MRITSLLHQLIEMSDRSWFYFQGLKPLTVGLRGHSGLVSCSVDRYFFPEIIACIVDTKRIN